MKELLDKYKADCNKVYYAQALKKYFALNTLNKQKVPRLLIKHKNSKDNINTYGKVIKMLQTNVIIPIHNVIILLKKMIPLGAKTKRMF